jgi:hypothetical protein
VDLSGSGWERQLLVESRGPMIVELPPPPAAPEIVTLEIKGGKLRADPPSLGIRIMFDPDQAVVSDEDEDDEDED